MGKHNAPFTRRAAWSWERLMGRGPRSEATAGPIAPSAAEERPEEPTEAAWLGVQPTPVPPPWARNGTAVLPRLAAQELTAERPDARTAHTGPIERVECSTDDDNHEVVVRYPDGRLMRVDTQRAAQDGQRQHWLIAAPAEARLESGMVVRVDRRAVMAVAVSEVTTTSTPAAGGRAVTQPQPTTGERMATRTYHVDDKELHCAGKEVRADEVGVTFALDGVDYTIDLTAKNASKLRTVFAPYIGAGRRKASGGTSRAKSAPAQPKPSAMREHNQAVREWARSEGIEISERGRIPARVEERYFEARRKEGGPSPAVSDPFKIGGGREDKP